jgi:CO/xanthine dehydrogenase FAD-binding subunit
LVSTGDWRAAASEAEGVRAGERRVENPRAEGPWAEGPPLAASRVEAAAPAPRAPSPETAPRSLAEALRRLAEDPDLLPVAGGTDLMVADRLQRSARTRVLDVTRLPELAGVRDAAGGLEIGAGVSFDELRRHPVVVRRYPALAAAAGEVGGWQIQTRATLGGNAANASPAGDALPVLLALEATVVLAGPEGEREVPYDRFHVGYRETALRPGELIVRFRLPDPPAGSRQAFRKVGTRAAQAISKVVVCGVGRVGGDGRVDHLRLAAGSVAATPVRLRAAEAAGEGGAWGDELADAVGRAARNEVTPIDDVRSTAAYRSAVLERVVRRWVFGLGAAT